MASELITITIDAAINAEINKVWEYWTSPEHITKWNFASDDWCCPSATNDLTIGGKFSSRMEAKDGSFGFDFYGVYTNIINNELIEYTLGDNRKVRVEFYTDNNSTKVISHFEAEVENSPELQKFGWQSILNNFKNYIESN